MLRRTSRIGRSAGIACEAYTATAGPSRPAAALPSLFVVWQGCCDMEAETRRLKMKKQIASLLTVLLVAGSAFAQVDDHAKAKKGAAIGGIAGAIAGAVIGNNRGHHSAKRGATVGVLAGGAAG